MMLLRIKALYPHQKWIARGLSVLLIIETIMNAYLIFRGEPSTSSMRGLNVNVSHHLTACSMVFDPAIFIFPLATILRYSMDDNSPPQSISKPNVCPPSSYRSAAASSSAWIPLLYDTIIFGLTLYRTVPSIRRQEASYIVERLLEDGMLYYSVIFTVTGVLTFMIVAAPPGTKNIAAQ
ncbi:hypothetical protein CVT24_006621 [Panaeolus cyanescens]|uniref:Uncharacterized protein n=1 Tax=Panaeolus cyanescens TaxID=181874 RepID=A0A409YS83_9AGAR|nr:hypothetical protein CVT24_006621 [Panaeolus cyanescens]